MPFRQRAKALFKTRSRHDDASSKSSSETASDRERYPSNVYRPDETMPRPKYRMPPKKEHKEKLEAFSFAGAWRRRSFHSTYSPMGTRAPSRRNSFLSSTRKSRPCSRNASVASTADDHHGPHGLRSREGPAAMATQPELSDEDGGASNRSSSPAAAAETSASPKRARTDSAAVGLREKDTSSTSTGGAIAKASTQHIDSVGPVPPPGVTAHDHQPFSEHDLTLAMQRSHLAVAV